MMQVIFDTAAVRMPIGSHQNLTGSDFTDLLDLNVVRARALGSE